MAITQTLEMQQMWLPRKIHLGFDITKPIHINLDEKLEVLMV
jgi:hypothetical protein